MTPTKVLDAINYGKTLIGIPYELWTSGPCQIREPMWVEDSQPPVMKEIISFDYYNNVSQDFNIEHEYPIGTLLMRNFRNFQDQGHLAIIIENKGKDSKILQSHYELSGFNGVNIRYTLEESHIGYYYEKIVLPENWLI